MKLVMNCSVFTLGLLLAATQVAFGAANCKKSQDYWGHDAEVCTLGRGVIQVTLDQPYMVYNGSLTYDIGPGTYFGLGASLLDIADGATGVQYHAGSNAQLGCEMGAKAATAILIQTCEKRYPQAQCQIIEGPRALGLLPGRNMINGARTEDPNTSAGFCRVTAKAQAFR